MGIIDLIKKISKNKSKGSTNNSQCHCPKDNHQQSCPNYERPRSQSDIIPTKRSPSSDNQALADASILPKRSSSASNMRPTYDIVAQSDASGRAVNKSPGMSPAIPSRRAVTRARTALIQRRGLSEAYVEELHPASVSPRLKPNDFILFYRDIAELLGSAVCVFLFPSLYILVLHGAPGEDHSIFKL